MLKAFHEDFEAILAKMSLEVENKETPCQQWIIKERKVRLVECVDEILHFFVIRSIQMDLTAFSSEERQHLFTVLEEIYKCLVTSLNDLIQVNPGSRMALKHLKFLAIVKEDFDIDDSQVPFHLRLCASEPRMKAIQVRNLYICERSSLKAGFLRQEQLGLNAALTYEKTLLEIRKAHVVSE